MPNRQRIQESNIRIREQENGRIDGTQRFLQDGRERKATGLSFDEIEKIREARFSRGSVLRVFPLALTLPLFSRFLSLFPFLCTFHQVLPLLTVFSLHRIQMLECTQREKFMYCNEVTYLVFAETGVSVRFVQWINTEKRA